MPRIVRQVAHDVVVSRPGPVIGKYVASSTDGGLKRASHALPVRSACVSGRWWVGAGWSASRGRAGRRAGRSGWVRDPARRQASRQ